MSGLGLEAALALVEELVQVWGTPSVMGRWRQRRKFPIMEEFSTAGLLWNAVSARSLKLVKEECRQLAKRKYSRWRIQRQHTRGKAWCACNRCGGRDRRWWEQSWGVGWLKHVGRSRNGRRGGSGAWRQGHGLATTRDGKVWCKLTKRQAAFQPAPRAQGLRMRFGHLPQSTRLRGVSNPFMPPCKHSRVTGPTKQRLSAQS